MSGAEGVKQFHLTLPEQLRGGAMVRVLPRRELFSMLSPASFGSLLSARKGDFYGVQIRGELAVKESLLNRQSWNGYYDSAIFNLAGNLADPAKVAHLVDRFPQHEQQIMKTLKAAKTEAVHFENHLCPSFDQRFLVEQATFMTWSTNLLGQLVLSHVILQPAVRGLVLGDVIRKVESPYNHLVMFGNEFLIPSIGPQLRQFWNAELFDMNPANFIVVPDNEGQKVPYKLIYVDTQPLVNELGVYTNRMLMNGLMREWGY